MKRPLLAIDTAGAVCGIALYQRVEEQQERLFTRELEGVRGHAQHILPLIDEVLAQANGTRGDLGAVAFNQGPGAFTGIRLGCSVAQGLALALDLPVIPVGMLPAFAAGLKAPAQDGLCLMAADARMDEVYFAAYGPYGPHGSYERLTLQWPVLISAQDCLPYIARRLSYWVRAAGVQQVTLAGDGWALMNQTLCHQTLQEAVPEIVLQDWHAQTPTVDVQSIARHAWDLWQQGRFVDPALALPLYLRDKVAFTTQERELGQGGNPKAAQPEDILLLPMSEHDLPEVAALEAESQVSPWRENQFKEALEAGYPAWVLRNSADQLVGLCVMMIAPDEAHLLTIAVSSDVRRQGLASKLLAQVLEVARQSQAQQIVLEVRVSNQAARLFYEQHGFVEIGMRRGYYPCPENGREDAQVLALRLTAGSSA